WRFAASPPHNSPDQNWRIEMGSINTVHHLAISTADIKKQIDFFSRVLGLELVALYWMHGVDNAWHAFLRLNEKSLLAFIFTPDNKEIQSEDGVTHAPHMGGASAPGTMQHVALNVDSLDDLFAFRDRLREHGIPAFGPFDHGMCQSLDFAGPERLTLEIATSKEPIDSDSWIDPEVVALANISAEELTTYRNPEPLARPAVDAVQQPPFADDKPHLRYPPAMYEKMLSASDEKLISRMSMADPPVPARSK
ncbi:MAG: VOC family protein, partial [Sphingomonadaceae bacterium]